MPVSRRDAIVVAVIACLAGLAAAFVAVSPTGSRVADSVVTFLFVAVVSWAAATAPWPVVAIASVVAVVLTGASGWTVVAAAGAVLAVLVGLLRTSLPWLRTTSAALACLALLHLDVDAFFGASAIVAGAVAVIIAAFGIGRREDQARRTALWMTAGAFVFVLLAVAGLAVAGLQAKSSLQAGYDHLQDGLDLLRDGDTALAADTLDRAAAEMRGANDDLDAFWAKPAALIPVVAQHRRAALDVLAEAARAAATVSAALGAADVDSIRLAGGTVDVEALAALAAPLESVDNAVVDMSATLRGASSPWLIGAAQRGLADGAAKVDKSLVQATATAAAAAHVPAMLGIDEPRRYLVVFTTPARARGLSGTMTNFAELTITDGTIRQTGFGRTSDLVAATAAGDDLVLDIPAELFARYGRFGAGSAATPVSGRFWYAVTMIPDAPTVASIMAQMYAAGRDAAPVDGVFFLDPTGLASLLDVAGPVAVPGLDQQITAASLRQFLLVDQYSLDPSVRQDVVEAAVGVSLQQFLSATLPAARDFAAALGPAATEGHLVAWAARAEEQNVFRLAGMSGFLPPPSDGDTDRDGLAVVTDNLAGNEIDGYLSRTVNYAASFDSATGDVTGELTVTVRNDAPSSGAADTVIGNGIGLPDGTSRMNLTIYSALDASDVTVDGAATTTLAGTQGGWSTTTIALDLAPGVERTVTLTLRGTLDTDHYRFVWRPQPLVNPDHLTLDVVAAQFDGVLDRTSVIDDDGIVPLR
jgi:hypothetical protein